MVDRSKWLASQQVAAHSILGKNEIPVSSQGSNFYNVGRWTCRVAQSKITDSLKLGNAFSREMVMNAILVANRQYVSEKKIVIASTPEKLPGWLHRASIGGVYHETWHTRYSCQRNLTMDEVYEPLVERWDLVPDWRPYLGMVLMWGNVVEDIRIERVGCREYPGADSVMPDLQDLILRMEAEGREASDHRKNPGADTLGTIMCIFRDLGLGYQSSLQIRTLEDYKTRNPKAWDLVTNGAMRPLLDRAINLSAKDDLGHWWIALEVVGMLYSLGHKQEKPQPQQPQQGGGAEPEPPPQPAPKDYVPDEEPRKAPSEEAPAGTSAEGDRPHLYRVGDRATLKGGVYKGRKVEVVFAGVPDQTGKQDLQFSLVEDED
jgi:hypothetical protein